MMKTMTMIPNTGADLGMTTSYMNIMHSTEQEWIA